MAKGKPNRPQRPQAVSVGRKEPPTPKQAAGVVDEAMQPPGQGRKSDGRGTIEKKGSGRHPINQVRAVERGGGERWVGGVNIACRRGMKRGVRSGGGNGRAVCKR